MPGLYPISNEFTTFSGKTATGKHKLYSVCNHCAFVDNVRDEAHIIQLSKGKLGSTRIKAKYHHLQNCSVAPQSIKDKYTIEGKVKPSQPQQAQAAAPAQAQQQGSNQPQVQSAEFEDKQQDFSDPNVRREAKRLLADFLFTHGLSWNPFQSKEWKKFIKYVNPQAPIVYRDELSNSLLDIVYSDVKNIVSSDMSNTHSHTILVDESQDGCKDPLINYMVGGSRGGPYLYDSEFPTTESLDAEHYTTQTIAVTKKIEDETKKPVSAYATDNCSTMKKSRRDWNDDTKFSVYGCIDHCLNKINEMIFKLLRYAQLSININFLITKLRITKLSQFLKVKILKSRVEEDMAKNNRNLLVGSQMYNQILNLKLETRKKNERVGIPAPGETRKWNNMYILMKFLEKHELLIRQLLVLLHVAVLNNQSIVPCTIFVFFV